MNIFEKAGCGRYAVGAAVPWFGLLLALTLGGCAPVPADSALIDLPEPAYPTGLDHWASKNTIIVGAFGGRIYSLREDGGQATKLMDIGERDCAGVIRVRVDDARNRLWVMSAAAICVYDLAALRLTRRVRLGDMSTNALANPLTDITLDAQGNAYAIDTGIDPVVYRIESTTFTGAVWNNAAQSSGRGVHSPRHFPLNAIAVTPEGTHLLYVDAYSGTLHVIDMKTRQQSTVAMAQPLFAVNALVARSSAGGIDVYAVSALNSSITVVGIDRSLGSAVPRTYATKHLEQPLAGIFVRDTLYVTNSQLLRHPAVSGAPDEPRRFSIARLSPAYFRDAAANPIMSAVLGP